MEAFVKFALTVKDAAVKHDEKRAALQKEFLELKAALADVKESKMEFNYLADLDSVTQEEKHKKAMASKLAELEDALLKLEEHRRIVMNRWDTQAAPLRLNFLRYLDTVIADVKTEYKAWDLFDNTKFKVVTFADVRRVKGPYAAFAAGQYTFYYFGQLNLHPNNCLRLLGSSCIPFLPNVDAEIQRAVIVALYPFDKMYTLDWRNFWRNDCCDSGAERELPCYMEKQHFSGVDDASR